MRVALIHYWLVRLRGGEAVLDNLMSVFPQADVYTNVYVEQAVQPLFEGRARPQTTWVNRLPFAGRLYPLYLPFMAPALSGLDLDDYDVVVSSEAGPAKWAMPSIDGRHICYAHTPMRYIWDQRHAYRRRTPRLAHPFYDAFGEEMRLRDVMSAYRVDDFVANSRFVARRIEKVYRRDSSVIHPPVKLSDAPAPQAPEDFYLFVGHLAPYKAVRTAVHACVALGRRLVVVGEGPDLAYVRRFAGQGVEHRGRLPRAELLTLMGRCRALLFPGVEDFGITPVEVLASGRPVIAQARGGVLDTVRHGVSGVLYRGTDAQSLTRGIREFEGWEGAFRPEDAIQAAQAFAPEVFAEKWRALLGLGPPASPAKALRPLLRGLQASGYSG
ncbi:glycosyltransferase [Caulobacter sp. S45]|uniref:glycosyltransferase n=1 Tax=Caulobacter sp. S45 TaxID=1641861 RepID=UPI0015775557|nr:glycosyltransferase [Caulobacter sp. S45]